VLPLSRLSSTEARRLTGLLFDLDDTVLDHGRLAEATYRALFRMKEAGLALYIVTGRPSGWAEVLGRMWPVDGAIAENGAIGLVEEGGHLVVVDRIPPAERASRSERLYELVARLRERFAELVPASDVGARRSDYTFDIGETRQVAPEIVEAASAEARRHGAFTTSSSVHLHVSFDRADKASGALWLLHRQTGLDPTEGRLRYAFVGDSENDAACFAAFQTSVGVANLRGRLTVRPRFITKAERGTGFAELAETLSELRREPTA
jgi:HAD superfamily hydrolase (TIGR01484 family)